MFIKNYREAMQLVKKASNIRPSKGLRELLNTLEVMSLLNN
jgi:hypothetical protein